MNKNSNFSYWKKGVKDGLPIGLGYLAVSFTFGIVGKKAGLSAFEAVTMSATNLTSAGQFAALDLIAISATYIEMAITQLIINLRYCLMSCSLSQKLDPKTTILQRLIMAFGITDEIFGVSATVDGTLSPYYTYGNISIALPGWALGTLLGILSGSIMSPRLLSALGIALYGMFIAIIVPPAKGNKVIMGVILASMFLSFAFAQIPVINEISSGFKIIILTVIIAGAAAIFFPIKEENKNEQ